MLSFIKNIGKNKQLEALIACIEMNMSNNYKDAAQADLQKFAETFASLKASGKLSDKQKVYYEELLTSYQNKMKSYTHKDQKPFWT